MRKTSKPQYYNYDKHILWAGGTGNDDVLNYTGSDAFIKGMADMFSEGEGGGGFDGSSTVGPAIQMGTSLFTGLLGGILSRQARIDQMNEYYEGLNDDLKSRLANNSYEELNNTNDVLSAYNSLDLMPSNRGENAREYFNESFVPNVTQSLLKGMNTGTAIGSKLGGLGAFASLAGGSIIGGISGAIDERKTRKLVHEKTNNFLDTIDTYNNTQFGNLANNTRQSYSNQYRNMMSNIGTPNYGAYGGQLYPFGGALSGYGGDWTNGLTFINNGGTHEENPYEGVPISIAQDGQPNLVEEGEVVWNDYVFSNRLEVPEEVMAELKLGRGHKTFADVVKKVQKEAEERPNDPIAQRGLDSTLQKLAGVQEEVRQEEEQLMAYNQDEDNAAIFADGGPIHISKSKRGTFTAAAKKHGMGVQEFAKHVLAHKDKYSSKMVKKAVFAHNAKKWKHALGGSLENLPIDYVQSKYSNGGHLAYNGMQLSPIGYYTFDPTEPPKRTFGQWLSNADEKVVDWTRQKLNILGDPEFWKESFNIHPERIRQADEYVTKKVSDGLEYLFYDPWLRNGINRFANWEERATKATSEWLDNLFNRNYLKNKGKVQQPIVITTPSSPIQETVPTVPIQPEVPVESQVTPPVEPEKPTIIWDANGGMHIVPTLGQMMSGRLPWQPYNSIFTTIPPVTSTGSASGSVAQGTGVGEPEESGGNGNKSKGTKSKEIPNPNNGNGGDDDVYDSNTNNLNSGAAFLRYMPIVGSALGAALAAGDTPDLEFANEIARAGRTAASQLKNVKANPINHYLQYKPFDRLFYSNMLGAQTAAQMRAIENMANGNIGAAQASLANAGYNANVAQGQLYRQGEEYNLAQRQKVEEFNRGTDMFNSQEDLIAQQINSAIAAQRAQFLQQAITGKAAAVLYEKNRLRQNLSTSLTNFFDNLGDYGWEAYNRNMINGNKALYYGIDENGNFIYKNSIMKNDWNNVSDSQKDAIAKQNGIKRESIDNYLKNHSSLTYDAIQEIRRAEQKAERDYDRANRRSNRGSQGNQEVN